MASSFKKKRTSSKPSHPRGCRPSLYNAQLLVSSGVPSIDSLLGHNHVPFKQHFNFTHICTGGGLAVGTVLLVGK